MNLKQSRYSWISSSGETRNLTVKVKFELEGQSQLEQLERLRSEDTPRRPMITHTIDQFILNPKSILLTSSYQIPSQNKVKAEKLEKFANNWNFRILLLT